MKATYPLPPAMKSLLVFLVETVNFDLAVLDAHGVVHLEVLAIGVDVLTLVQDSIQLLPLLRGLGQSAESPSQMVKLPRTTIMQKAPKGLQPRLETTITLLTKQPNKKK